MYNLRSMSLTRQCTFSVCILLFLQCMYLAAATEQQKESLLRELFQRENKPDLQKAEKILQATSQLEEGIKKAGDASTSEEGVKILNQYLSAENVHLALNKKRALELKDKYLESIRQEQERQRQIRAIKDIRVTTGDGGQLVIRKYVNRGYQWKLYLLPASKSNYDAAREIWSARSDYYSNKVNADTSQAKMKLALMEHDSSSTSSLMAYSRYMDLQDKAYDKVNNLLPKITQNSQAQRWNVTSNVCSLDNIQTPVLLVAVVELTNRPPHFWYMKYIPGESENQWELSVPKHEM